MEFKIRIKNQRQEDNKYFDCCHIEYIPCTAICCSLDEVLQLMYITDNSEYIKILPYEQENKVIAVKKSEIVLITEA